MLRQSPFQRSKTIFRWWQHVEWLRIIKVIHTKYWVGSLLYTLNNVLFSRLNLLYILDKWGWVGIEVVIVLKFQTVGCWRARKAWVQTSLLYIWIWTMRLPPLVQLHCSLTLSLQWWVEYIWLGRLGQTKLYIGSLDARVGIQQRTSVWVGSPKLAWRLGLVCKPPRWHGVGNYWQWVV